MSALKSYCLRLPNPTIPTSSYFRVEIVIVRAADEALGAPNLGRRESETVIVWNSMKDGLAKANGSRRYGNSNMQGYVRWAMGTDDQHAQLNLTNFMK